ncbi:MAG: hypothetical protein LC098_10540 [Burkholderiales bacterium]|nr:hypothetical protein [Burkholderiales bacterium]
MSTTGGSMQNELAVQVSRKVGAMVCAVRGHDYFYPGGEINSWCAYACVRCGQFDRPLESLPYRPDDADDYIGWNDNDEREQRIEQEYELARRWFAGRPWPRWL